jgi:hypothetical protein
VTDERQRRPGEFVSLVFGMGAWVDTAFTNQDKEKKKSNRVRWEGCYLVLE